MLDKRPGHTANTQGSLRTHNLPVAGSSPARPTRGMSGSSPRAARARELRADSFSPRWEGDETNVSTRPASDSDLPFLREVDRHVSHEELTDVVARRRVMVAEVDRAEVGYLPRATPSCSPPRCRPRPRNTSTGGWGTSTPAPCFSRMSRPNSSSAKISRSDGGSTHGCHLLAP